MLLVWLFCGTQGCYCIQVQELVQGLRCSLAWIRTLRRVLNLSYVWDTNPWSRFSKHVCPAKSASRFVVAPFYVPDVSARCDVLSTSYFFRTFYLFGQGWSVLFTQNHGRKDVESIVRKRAWKRKVLPICACSICVCVTLESRLRNLRQLAIVAA